MTIFALVRAFLISDIGTLQVTTPAAPWNGAGLHTQIAALVGTRVYPLRLPQKGASVLYPAIVITPISGRRETVLRGSASLASPRYQLDAWAETFQAAQNLGVLMRQRLEGFVGTLTDNSVSPVNTVRTSMVFEDEHEFFEEDPVSGGFYRHSADYFIWYQTQGGQL